jgi:riboflavin kinase/FMN adenylyltransferase
METKNISTFSKNDITNLAIGRFDGLHLGHQALFQKLDKNGAVLVIDTGKANLTPAKYLPTLLDLPFFVYQLDDIKDLSCEEFVQLLLSDFPNSKKIIVGDDFRFGKNRSGGVDDLVRLFVNVDIVNELFIDSIGVHSRFIRNLLLNGNVEKAKNFLGRNYRICGNVIHGQGLGSKELYSTLNIECKDFFIPNEGVYITRTILNSKQYKSVSFIGHRVCTDGNYAIETHILEEKFDENCLSLCLDFCTRLRGNMYFDNLSELKEQINFDINNAKKYFDKDKI